MYEELLAAESATLPALPYSADDLYILYTGGTTGMPKGVLWRQQDVFYNGLGGHLPGAAQRKITCENAGKFYGLM